MELQIKMVEPNFSYPKNERERRATTGMDGARFQCLLLLFESGYFAEFGKRIEQ
jgi:hypothetical protein